MSKLRIVLIVLLVLILSGLTIFFFYLRNSEEVVAEISFNNGKAEYQSEEVEFKFSGSKLLNSGKLQVIKASNFVFDDNHLYFRSYNTHVLSGKILDFTGKLRIKFKLGERMVSKFGKNLHKKLYILAFEPSFSFPGKDTVWAATFLPVKADLTKKEAFTYFDFSELNYADSLQNYKIGFELICFEESMNTIYSEDYTYKIEGNFAAVFNTDISKNGLTYTLTEFEKQYSKIRNLGLSIKRSSKPIQLRVTEKTETGDVNYIQNIFRPENQWFEINKRPYLNRKPESLSNSEIEDLKNLSGKGLMQMALNNYVFKFPFNKAVAQWYVPVALSDTTYEHEFEPADFKQLNKSLFSESEQNTKLNMLFFSFLMRKDGFYFASNLYKNLKSNAQSLQYNIQKTLENKKLRNIYIEFFDVLLRKPEKLVPSLRAGDVLDYLSYDEVDWKVKAAQANMFSQDINLDLGILLKQSSDNVILVNYELNNFSAAFLKLDLQSVNSDTKEKFRKGELKLKISLSGDARTGIFVYKNIGGKLILTQDELKFYSTAGSSIIEISNSGEFLIPVLNFDDSARKKKRSITLKFEIISQQVDL